MENEETIITFPYLLTNIPIGPDKKPIIDTIRAQKVYESVQPIRNTVIESALHIESTLTSALLHFTAGQNYPIHNILRELVFDAEFCTFMQKRKMLSKLFEMKGENISCLTRSESKSLRRNINRIISERDKFAHGFIVIHCRNYKAGIKYFSGGEKIDPIDHSYLDGFLDVYEECEKMLTKLNNFVRENNLIKT